MRPRGFIVAGIGLPLVACAARAQIAVLVNDRTNDAVWRLADLNGTNAIEEPGEVRLWFSAANIAGTPGLDNPTCLGTASDGTAIVGDQGLGSLVWLRDLTQDGDAQDADESRIVADGTNASQMSLAFPTGAAFDNSGALYIVNAGNGFGPDAIYRLVDTTGDGDFQEAGEITYYVANGAFGPGNGPFSPQEMAFLAGAIIPIGLLRNSSAGLHGVYRFADLSGNGRADDPGEFFAYFDATNGSAFSVSAGFGLAFDLYRPGALYMLQTGTGSVDQLLRLSDKDGDLTAQQAGEALLAWETAEANFINIDLLSLADGRVLVSDSDLDRIIMLSDLDGDDRFLTAGERTAFFTNSGLMLGDVRQIAPMTLPAPCYADCNQSGSLTIADFGCFQTTFVAQDPYADCNQSGGLTIADFACFQTEFVNGCP